MGYYEDIKERDLITTLKRLLQSGGYYFRDDGKIMATHRLAWDSPWHHVKHHPLLDCHTWHQILFDAISMHLPKDQRFVPSGCQQCYKVVVRPKTLKQLFALLDVQKRLDRPSKCGIETREEVHALYGGYFYNIGLDSALECYKVVRREINEHPLLGPDIAVIVKRSCTEMEHGVGPSDKWEITPRQLEIEGILDTMLVKDDVDRKQPDTVLRYIHRKWIEFAYFVNDATYAEFTDGPLYPGYVTYHHLAENNPSGS